jgi:hypothetical protein
MCPNILKNLNLGLMPQFSKCAQFFFKFGSYAPIFQNVPKKLIILQIFSKFGAYVPVLKMCPQIEKNLGLIPPIF